MTIDKLMKYPQSSGQIHFSNCSFDNAGTPVMRLRAIEHRILKEMIDDCRTPWALIQKAKIILLAAEGHEDEEIARRLNVSGQDEIKAWRMHWSDTSKNLLAFESRPEILRTRIETLFATETQSYALASFTAEEICQLLALCGENAS